MNYSNNMVCYIRLSISNQNMNVLNNLPIFLYDIFSSVCPNKQQFHIQSSQLFHSFISLEKISTKKFTTNTPV